MNTEQQIEFDKIKEIWAQLAVTGAAKEEIANTSVILDEAELNVKLRETTNSREMMEKLGNPPLQDVTEVRKILTEAGKGACLTPYQLERVEKVLVAVERLKYYLAGICRQIRCEEVDDHASNVLYDVRTRIIHAEENIKQKAEQVIRNNKDCMADTFYTLRNGRVCVPVKKEYRYRIDGTVLDKSATGNTVFIEPAALGKYYEELQLLRVEEENEVYKILYTLSALVSDAIPAMEENMRMMEKPTMFAKVFYARSRMMNGIIRQEQTS